MAERFLSSSSDTPASLGRYRLEGVLGAGAMGRVYRAYDTERARHVALKVLPDSVANDDHFRARFARECQLAAQLRDPHVVPIHDFGQIDGQLFLDMRLVDGTDLARRLTETGALPPRMAAELVSQAAEALDAAHAEGLVHRDVKPSNLLLSGRDESPFVHLVDFGIARTLPKLTSDTTITAAAQLVGTLAYMAPERIEGQPGDQRSDVYSLACVLFECLTGRAPFQGAPVVVLNAHVHADRPRPTTSQPELVEAWDAVVARGMATDPDQRYGSAGELASAARSALARQPEAQNETANDHRGAPLPARRRALAALVAVAVCALVGGAAPAAVSPGGGHVQPLSPGPVSTTSSKSPAVADEFFGQFRVDATRSIPGAPSTIECRVAGGLLFSIPQSGVDDGPIQVFNVNETNADTCPPTLAQGTNSLTATWSPARTPAIADLVLFGVNYRSVVVTSSAFGWRGEFHAQGISGIWIYSGVFDVRAPS
jgi:serine/threonine protein kinase